MALDTTPWNIQDHLRTPEDRAAFLEAAFAEAPEDAAYPARALGEVSRARHNMSQVARDIGLSRAGLHKALSRVRHSRAVSTPS